MRHSTKPVDDINACEGKCHSTLKVIGAFIALVAVYSLYGTYL